jgi:Uncharacterized small protein
MNRSCLKKEEKWGVGLKDEKIKSGNVSIKDIEEMVRSIKYGSITIVIQDGIIVQIEKNEKIRIK